MNLYCGCVLEGVWERVRNSHRSTTRLTLTEAPFNVVG